MFESVWALYIAEQAEVNLVKAERVWHMSFKRFMMIPDSTETNLINEMIGIDFSKYACRTYVNATKKWYKRRDMPLEDAELNKKEPVINYLRGIPNEWCKILKQQCRVCNFCSEKTICNSHHLLHIHDLSIFCYKRVWLEIKVYNDKKRSNMKKSGLKALKKINKQEVMEHWKPILKKGLEFNNRQILSILKKTLEVKAEKMKDGLKILQI